MQWNIVLEIKLLVSRRLQDKQETRILSQVLNRAMPHSRNQLQEGINRKMIIFYLAVQL